MDTNKYLLPAAENEVSVRINRHLLHFTNLDKIYWPEEKITKRDLIHYYYRISAFILPHLKGHPHSLNRFPDGITGAHFFQKNVTGKIPDWIPTLDYTAASTGEQLQILVCDSVATLLYMVNFGCIEMHPWLSRTDRLEKPDFCLLDIDPDVTNTFEEVIATAQVFKEVIEEMGFPSYPKTSGSSGMHILIPLAGKYDFDTSRALARHISTTVNQRLPKLTSMERHPDKRKGRIYLDYLQNSVGQTVAAAYSVRPRKGAPVSAPLHWHEVTSGLKVSDFTLFNMAARLQKEGDLLKGILGKGITLKNDF